MAVSGDDRGLSAECEDDEKKNPGTLLRGLEGRRCGHDFNIVSPDHDTMKALTDNGFQVPEKLQKTNVRQTKFYDQIAFRLKEQELMPGAANVFRFKRAVFRDRDFAVYKDEVKNTSAPAKGIRGLAELEKYYKDTWRTFQMSDHDLLWVELKIDFSTEYLKDRMADS